MLSRRSPAVIERLCWATSTNGLFRMPLLPYFLLSVAAISAIVPPTCTVPARRHRLRAPRDRSGQGPIDLEYAGSVPVFLQFLPVAAVEPVSGHPDEVGGALRPGGAGIVRKLIDRPDGAPGDYLSPQGTEIAAEGIGNPSRSTCGDGPAGNMAEDSEDQSRRPQLPVCRGEETNGRRSRRTGRGRVRRETCCGRDPRPILPHAGRSGPSEPGAKGNGAGRAGREPVPPMHPLKAPSAHVWPPVRESPAFPPSVHVPLPVRRCRRHQRGARGTPAGKSSAGRGRARGSELKKGEVAPSGCTAEQMSCR